MRCCRPELVGLRTILLNLFYKLANGERLTAEEMRGIIERADADKHKKAVQRLRSRKHTLFSNVRSCPPLLMRRAAEENLTSLVCREEVEGRFRGAESRH